MKRIIIILIFAISSSLFAQTVLTIEGTVVNNTVTGTWSGINIPRSVPTIFTYRNNSITSVNANGYMLQAGDEGPASTNNNLDGEIITGNKFTWNGTSGGIHGIMTGYNKNAVIKYNYVDKPVYGIVFKSGTASGVNLTYTAGGAGYNIFKNCVMAVRIKGMNGVCLFNNVFYDDAHSSSANIIYISSNSGAAIPAPSTGIKIKNNIFYTKYRITNIVLEKSGDTTNFESDYNIFYCEAGTPKFSVAGVSLTFAQWQAMGYDTHSIVVNPNFINFTDFVPSQRLDYGTNLGAEWQTGLSVNAEWGKTDPATTNQNGSWQVGARLYAGKVYYLSPAGNDATGNGSIVSPWFTLNKAWTVVAAGDLIYMRGGTYAYTSQQTLTGKNGAEGNLIKVWVYPGETPIITKGAAYSGDLGIYFNNNDYIHLKGLTITGFTQKITGGNFSGLRVENSSNCIFELLNYHHNGFPFNIVYESTNNIVLNCDFHHQFDPYTVGDPYGNGDGTDCPTSSGTTNTFRGCRSWNNSDDGFDFWAANGNWIIENCWAWNQGYKEDGVTTGGNGGGFKLGKTDDYPTTVLRTVTNCLAFHNRTWGFLENGAKCNIELYNNIAYKNGVTNTWSGGFHFNIAGIEYYIKNNIAYNNIPSEKDLGTLTNVNHNSWNTGVTLTNADFLSLDTTGVSGARGADGSLPVLNFLRLASTSDLINAGVNVGLPFNGIAPDLGAFEFIGQNTPPTGIQLTGNNSTIKVYPNPVSEELIIEIEDKDINLNFEIINSIGHIVFKGNLSEKTVVPTTNFSPGIYFTRITNGRSFELKKIVIL